MDYYGSQGSNPITGDSVTFLYIAQIPVRETQEAVIEFGAYMW